MDNEEITVACGDYTFCVNEDRSGCIRLQWWDEAQNKWAAQPLLIDTKVAPELLRLAAAYAEARRVDK